MKIKKSTFWDKEQNMTDLSFTSFDKNYKEEKTRISLTENEVIDLREVIGISDSIKFKDVSVCVYNNNGELIGDAFNYFNYKWNKNENKHYVYLGRMQLDSTFVKIVQNKHLCKIIAIVKHPKLSGENHCYTIEDSETQSYEFFDCELEEINIDFDTKTSRHLGEFGEELLCFKCEKLDIKKVEKEQERKEK